MAYYWPAYHYYQAAAQTPVGTTSAFHSPLVPVIAPPMVPVSFTPALAAVHSYVTLPAVQSHALLTNAQRTAQLQSAGVQLQRAISAEDIAKIVEILKVIWAIIQAMNSSQQPVPLSDGTPTNFYYQIGRLAVSPNFFVRSAAYPVYTALMQNMRVVPHK